MTAITQKVTPSDTQKVTPSDEELNDLIQSYLFSLRGKCTIHILSQEWMPETNKAYAILTLSYGESGLVTRYVQRSLYDCDYSAEQNEENTMVDAIIAIADARWPSPRIRYSFEHELKIQRLSRIVEVGGAPVFTPRWFCSGEEFSPTESQALWAERLIKVGGELRFALEGMPSGTLEERFGGQRALAKTLWLAASAKAYMS